jgi:RNA polymerase sigma-70 factor (ECF subfamily)
MGAEELLALAAVGDRPAFEEIYRRYYPAVVRRLTHLTGPAIGVGDMVQETFVQVYTGLRQFRGDAAPHHWVLRIATNVARAHYRRRRRLPWRLWDRPEEEAAVVAPGQGVDESYPTLSAVHGALNRMSPALREAVILYELEGLTLAEMGHALRIPLHTAASRVRRGRDRLRRALERMGYVPGRETSGDVALCGSEPR